MPKTKHPTPPLHTTSLRRLAAPFVRLVRGLAAKCSFVWRMFPFLCRLYPDASYLATKRPQNIAATTQLSKVADGLAGIAQTVGALYEVEPPAQTFNTVINTMQLHLCNNCARRAACWGKSYGALIDALFALKPILEQTEHVGVEHFAAGLSHCVHPAAMASEMTRAYALYRSQNEARLQAQALRTALTEQYGAVAEALDCLGAQLSVQGQPEHAKTCQLVEQFTALGFPPSEAAVTRMPDGALQVVVTLTQVALAKEALQHLAQVVSGVCQCRVGVPQKLSCHGVTSLLFQEQPKLSAVYGVAFAAAKGGVSGDAVQQFCHGHTAQMVLCDGMGTGRPAAVDGNLAAELTARLLKAGLSTQTVARLVNTALALKGEEESSATLDLVSVDLYTGQASLFKAGAASGFLVQEGKAYAMEATSLPVGILPEVQGAQATVQLQAGDVVILVSDGMLVQGEDWVIQHLNRAVAVGQSPQQMAERLVRIARSYRTMHPDDITAAVMQLVEASYQ